MGRFAHIFNLPSVGYTEAMLFGGLIYLFLAGPVDLLSTTYPCTPPAFT